MISDVYQPRNTRYLDPRTVYIVYNEKNLYLWLGSEILPTNREQYLAKAESHIKLLQQYERAPKNHTVIHQGNEPQEFWGLWPNAPNERYNMHHDWEHYFVDLATSKNEEGITYFRNQEDENQAQANKERERERERDRDEEGEEYGDDDDVVEITEEDVRAMGLDVWSETDRKFVEDMVRLWWDRRAVVRGGSIECCGVRIM